MNTLHDLLKKAGSYHPMYGDRLAMHLPMVLIALSKLGASNEKLIQIFQQNLDELEIVPIVTRKLKNEDIPKNLGNTNEFANFLGYFQSEIHDNDVEQVLKKTVPILISGLSASAFHAMIRLAYAIEINHSDEVAIALAFWCAEYQAFDISQERTSKSLPNILRSVVDIGVNHTFSPGIIVDRMKEIGSLLKAKQSTIQPEKIILDEVRKFALTVFYAKEEFTLLHTVTGCHAFSKILPFVNDKELAIRELWQAIVVAYLSTGLSFKQKAFEYNNINKREFEDLIKLSLSSEDSHKTKLFYTCLSEYRTYGEQEYYDVAKRIFT